MEKKIRLLVGEVRGLGFAMVKEYLARDWQVVATAREKSGTALRGPNSPNVLPVIWKSRGWI